MHLTIDTSGNYELSIVLKQGIDLDTATVRVQNKISSVVSDFPAEIQAQGVTVTKNTPESVFMFDLIYKRDELAAITEKFQYLETLCWCSCLRRQGKIGGDEVNDFTSFGHVFL